MGIVVAGGNLGEDRSEVKLVRTSGERPAVLGYQFACGIIESESQRPFGGDIDQ